MERLLLSLAPMMPGRMEALAELFLVDALRDPDVRERLATLVPNLRDRLDWAAARPSRQETSDDGVARHDLVLTDPVGRRLHLELKGYANLTGRQVEALRKGSDPVDPHRIDILIAPNPSGFEAHPSVARVSWDSIDGIVSQGHQGFSSLWLGGERVKASEVLRDLLERARYKGAAVTTAQWGVLWSSVNVVKECLKELEWGKSDGPKTGSEYWYYGASAWAEKAIVWVGWVLHQLDGKSDYRLILEDPGHVIDASSFAVRDLGFTKVKRAIQLWPSEAPGEVVDMKQAAERVRILLSKCEGFRELLKDASTS